MHALDALERRSHRLLVREISDPDGLVGAELLGGTVAIADERDRFDTGVAQRRERGAADVAGGAHDEY